MELPDRAKYVSSTRFSEIDIITIRWQAAEPPNGEGLSIPIIAEAWQASYETIRRIVKRISYSWVGENQAGAPKVDPRIRAALDKAIRDSVGLDDAALARIMKAQEDFAAGRGAVAEADDGPNAMLSEEMRRKIEEQAAGYGARITPRAPPQTSTKPVVEVTLCGVKNEFELPCMLPRGHEGEHKDATAI
jgi:hypothetical protein